MIKDTHFKVALEINDDDLRHNVEEVIINTDKSKIIQQYFHTTYGIQPFLYGYGIYDTYNVFFTIDAWTLGVI